MEPLIVRTRDRNGQVVEKFFVRVGNMSQELALSEVSAYVAERP